jgi:hypothetical protein
MTRLHNLRRLHWMLQEGGSEPVYAFLTELGKAGNRPGDRKAILASIRDGKYAGMDKLSATGRALVMDAARELDAALADIPDRSLAEDWSYLCNQMARDLQFGPRNALAALDAVRRSILVAGGARMFVIGSADSQQALEPGIRELAGSLQNAAANKASYRAVRRIDQRLLAREPENSPKPLFVGLLNANSQGGVFLNSAPAPTYRDTGRDSLLDYIASNLYAGHGAHGIFMKTWAAGLAYSNGIRISPAAGRLNYYAERTPELPQTLQFVIDELAKAKPDVTLIDYAIAGAFEGTRAASPYEERGEAMANDLADGLTPEIITRFHRGILDLRGDPKLGDELFRRMNAVYGKVLPGMNVKARDVAGGVYFVIGPERQLAAWEQYLRRADTPGALVFRLYPRDFWLTE